MYKRILVPLDGSAFAEHALQCRPRSHVEPGVGSIANHGAECGRAAGVHFRVADVDLPNINA